MNILGDSAAESNATADQAALHQFTLRFSVEDRTALWDAAARQCAETAGLDHEEICEMIGPREDPQVEDCLMLLLAPSRIAGCRVEDIELSEVTRRPILFQGDPALSPGSVKLEALSGLLDQRMANSTSPIL